jgi:hypothetical protein
MQNLSLPHTASQEFAGAQLGDQRLNRRLVRLVEEIQRAPSRSLPELFKSPSQAESRAGAFQGDHLGGDPRSVT